MAKRKLQSRKQRIATSGHAEKCSVEDLLLPIPEKIKKKGAG